MDDILWILPGICVCWVLGYITVVDYIYFADLINIEKNKRLKQLMIFIFLPIFVFIASVLLIFKGDPDDSD